MIKKTTQKNITTPKKEVIRKKFSGVVVSDKSDKTIVVLVERVKIHPKYNKRYTVSKKYKVHDEKNQYKEGNVVNFVECRPISKDKKWRVISN
ncbi:MAG: 30S ribosomal protein S17 [Planctomycetes bacterium]|jgi:small subunit ribosomal protein S17|nr:30S ribosomal protein S17 [Planctomycetota bacterium]